jgi:hypothetical protein
MRLTAFIRPTKISVLSITGANCALGQRLRSSVVKSSNALEPTVMHRSNKSANEDHLKARVLFQIPILFVLAGCVSFSNIQSPAELQLGPEEGIVVIGAPSGTKLVIHSGDVKDGKFRSDGWLPDGIVGTAEGGYLVRKLRTAPTGRGYGLVSIVADRHYTANCGQRIAMFNVRPGEVTYLTDFSFLPSGSSVGVQNSTNLKAAAAYMKARFFGAAPEVKQGEITSVPQGRCQSGGGTTYIPIYIPHGKGK